MHALRRRHLLALTGASALAKPALAQAAAPLRFVPSANLFSLDPLWSAALVSYHYGYMVYDQLYGLDASFVPQPQMVEAHETSADGLTWRFLLREGLRFHDGEPVRGADCVASIRRWSQRDPFGQYLAANLVEMRATEDRRFEIQLKAPFPLLTHGLGSTACFIMPERVASTSAFTQITEYVGSGPFRFLRDEWVSGSRAAFARFPGYVPRQESPAYWSGGKRVLLDRVEWAVIPDFATAALALQQGEVDWLERPLLDLVPRLRRAPGVTADVVDPLGAVATLMLNTRDGPFANPALRRALLPAMNQQDCMVSIVGEQRELVRTGVGFFHPASPDASTAGLEALTGPRDLAAARRAVQEAGYRGERIVQMAVPENPASYPVSEVVRATLTAIGLNVDFHTMDLGTMLSRTRSQDAAAPWHCYCAVWAGFALTNPGSNIPLYGPAPDPRMDGLKAEWLGAPDQTARRRIADTMQRRAFEALPFIPLGQYALPQAYRSNISGIVKASTCVFWNVRKG